MLLTLRKDTILKLVTMVTAVAGRLSNELLLKGLNCINILISFFTEINKLINI